MENRNLDRVQAVIEVLLLSGLVSGFIAAIPFSIKMRKGIPFAQLSAGIVAGSLLLEAGLTFALLWIVMRAHRETPGDFGIHRKDLRANVVLGLAVVPVFFLTNLVVAESFRILVPKYYLTRNPLTEIIRTPRELGLFIVSAWVAGGLKEEIQRAFILSRFRKHLGGSALGLAVWSVAFGAGHYVQGIQGVVAATLFGLLFGILYLARRSLIAPIIAHGMYDTLALLGYWVTRG